MDKTTQSKMMLISGFFAFLVAAIYPFVESWNNPEAAKYSVAYWTFFGALNIYYSQKYKYEEILKAKEGNQPSQNKPRNDDLKYDIAFGIILTFVFMGIGLVIGRIF